MATRGINKVIIVGNLGQDPETRYTPGGMAVTNVSIATSDSWKDKQSGEMQEKTGWHRVVFFNRLAEIAGEYLKKGSKVYLEGRLQTRKWQDQSGQDRYTTEIVAGEMQMLDSRGGASAGGGMADASYDNAYSSSGSGGASAHASSSSSSAAPAPASRPAQKPAPAPEMDGFDDDIPF